MLEQLQKFTVSREEFSGTIRREKLFIAGLLTAAATLGSLLSLGMSTVNTVNMATIRRHVAELQNEIPNIQTEMEKQLSQLQIISKTIQETVIVLNTQNGCS